MVHLIENLKKINAVFILLSAETPLLYFKEIHQLKIV